MTMDIMALMASWICLAFDDVSRVYILGRVLRVMRPMRTLRMLSDINTVLQTVVEALPLFGQVSDFAFKRMNSAGVMKLRAGKSGIGGKSWCDVVLEMMESTLNVTGFVLKMMALH